MHGVTKCGHMYLCQRKQLLLLQISWTAKVLTASTAVSQMVCGGKSWFGKSGCLLLNILLQDYELNLRRTIVVNENCFQKLETSEDKVANKANRLLLASGKF